jgi:hypothetical protein
MAAQRFQINLMNEYVRQVRKRKLLFTKVQFYAAGLLIVYGAILLAVIGYRGLLALELRSKQEKIADETRILTQLQPLETSIYFVQNKMSLIQDFWSEMPDVRAVLSRFIPILPEEVVVNSVVFSEATNTVEMETTAKDIFIAYTWLTTLEQQAPNT